MSKKLFTIFLISFSLVAGWPILSQAVTVAWYQTGTDSLALILDTDGQSINTLSGELIIVDQKIKLKNISDANSLVNFWLERPQESQGKTIFSGIIPSGFRGEGLILTLNFNEKVSPNLVKISNFKAFLNDGEGKEVKVTIKNTISDSDNLKQLFAKTEKVLAPENFSPQIIKNKNLPTDDFYLIFGTQDKSSGIAYYGAYESRWPVNIVKQNQDLNWVKILSPYLLKDQRLGSLIYVKAVNQNGGVRIVKLSPQFSLVWWYEHWLFSFIIILIVAFFLRTIFSRFLKKK